MAGIGRPVSLGKIVANIKAAHPEIPVQYHSHAGHCLFLNYYKEDVRKLPKQKNRWGRETSTVFGKFCEYLHITHKDEFAEGYDECDDEESYPDVI